MMRINELAKKYNMNPRTIDYYTQKKLIPCKKGNERNNYRDYGEEAETVIKKIIILRDAGLSERQIKDALSNPSYFTTQKWNELIKEMQSKIENLKTMISDAIDIRDTESKTLSVVHMFQDTLQWKLFTRGMAKGIRSAETMVKEDNESDAVNDILEKALGFAIKMKNKLEKGNEHDSPEVQNLVEKFLFRIIDDYYGTTMYIILSSVDEFIPEMAMKDNVSTEEGKTIRKMLRICQEWFFRNKGVKECAEIERFMEEFKVQISEMDEAMKETSIDGFDNLIIGLCELPNSINGQAMQEYFKPIVGAFGALIRSYDVSEEEKKMMKQLVEYIYNAFFFYFNNPHKCLVDINAPSIPTK